MFPSVFSGLGTGFKEAFKNQHPTVKTQVKEGFAINATAETYAIIFTPSIPATNIATILNDASGIVALFNGIRIATTENPTSITTLSDLSGAWKSGAQWCTRSLVKETSSGILHLHYPRQEILSTCGNATGIIKTITNIITGTTGTTPITSITIFGIKPVSTYTTGLTYKGPSGTTYTGFRILPFYSGTTGAKYYMSPTALDTDIGRLGRVISLGSSSSSMRPSAPPGAGSSSSSMRSVGSLGSSSSLMRPIGSSSSSAVGSSSSSLPLVGSSSSSLRPLGSPGSSSSSLPLVGSSSSSLPLVGSSSSSLPLVGSSSSSMRPLGSSSSSMRPLGSSSSSMRPLGSSSSSAPSKPLVNAKTEIYAITFTPAIPATNITTILNDASGIAALFGGSRIATTVNLTTPSYGSDLSGAWGSGAQWCQASLVKETATNNYYLHYPRQEILLNCGNKIGIVYSTNNITSTTVIKSITISGIKPVAAYTAGLTYKGPSGTIYSGFTIIPFYSGTKPVKYYMSSTASDSDIGRLQPKPSTSSSSAKPSTSSSSANPPTSSSSAKPSTSSSSALSIFKPGSTSSSLIASIIGSTSSSAKIIQPPINTNTVIEAYLVYTDDAAGILTGDYPEFEDALGAIRVSSTEVDGSQKASLNTDLGATQLAGGEWCKRGLVRETGGGAFFLQYPRVTSELRCGNGATGIITYTSIVNLKSTLTAGITLTGIKPAKNYIIPTITGNSGRKYSNLKIMPFNGTRYYKSITATDADYGRLQNDITAVGSSSSSSKKPLVAPVASSSSFAQVIGGKQTTSSSFAPVIRDNKTTSSSYAFAPAPAPGPSEASSSSSSGKQKVYATDGTTLTTSDGRIYIIQNPTPTLQVNGDNDYDQLRQSIDTKLAEQEMQVGQQEQETNVEQQEQAQLQQQLQQQRKQQQQKQQLKYNPEQSLTANLIDQLVADFSNLIDIIKNLLS